MPEPKKITLDTDLTTLTDQELGSHQQACWDRSMAIDKERERRNALPWVWDSDEKTVTTIRGALNKPGHRGADKPEPWIKPTSAIDAYLKGDRVTHNGDTWVATGRGMIMDPPGTQPVDQPELWRKETTTGEVTPGA